MLQIVSVAAAEAHLADHGQAEAAAMGPGEELENRQPLERIDAKHIAGEKI
jgi:hypothetical protein